MMWFFQDGRLSAQNWKNHGFDQGVFEYEWEKGDVTYELLGCLRPLLGVEYYDKGIIDHEIKHINYSYTLCYIMLYLPKTFINHTEAT